VFADVWLTTSGSGTMARYIGDAMHTYVQQRSGNADTKPPIIIGFAKVSDIGD